MKQKIVPPDFVPLNAPTVDRIKVVRVQHNIGDGREGNPYRPVTDYFDSDGTFLARHDCHKDEP